jgi:DNA-binding XRE family transcriptional regulator
MSRIWYGASRGEPWVTTAVREHFARCVAACLANEHISRYLGEQRPGWSRPSLEASPIVRVEFEHAFVLGRLGESLCAARHKAWGNFLGVRPLEAEDPVHPSRIVYAFKAAAPYQRRFEQRCRLRRMLGKEYARLVPRAMGAGKGNSWRTRQRAGLTQEQLSFRAELSRPYISQLERNSKSPTVATLFLICDALDVSAAEIVGRVDAARKRKSSR